MTPKPKFIAIMGPSGVGKSTIMHELERIDSRFTTIKTHVTRPLRDGETDRVSLSLGELFAMRRRKEALAVNCIYTSYYAALPRKPIQDALMAGAFPMCDYKIQFVANLRAELLNQVFTVYLLPPDFESIKTRLRGAGRKIEEVRISEDMSEVANLDAKYPGQIDFKIVSEEGKIEKIAAQIRDAYLSSIST